MCIAVANTMSISVYTQTYAEIYEFVHVRRVNSLVGCTGHKYGSCLMKPSCYQTKGLADRNFVIVSGWTAT